MLFHTKTIIKKYKGQPVNATSLPSPTMPTFNMAQTPNGQPAGAEAVYSNGIPHTYPGRKSSLKTIAAVAFFIKNFSLQMHFSYQYQHRA